jgi:hypothetical protein
MGSEVFRFVSVRPPAPSAAAPPLDLGLPLADSRFNGSLGDERRRAERAALLDMVAQFVASPDFVSYPGNVDPRLIELVEALAQLDDEGFDQAAASTFSRLFSHAPANYLRSDAYRSLSRRIAESIVAAAISPNVSAQFLARIARVLAVTEGLAAGRAVHSMNWQPMTSNIEPIAREITRSICRDNKMPETQIDR